MGVSSRYSTVIIRQTTGTHPPLHQALKVQPLPTMRFQLWFPCTNGAAHDHPFGVRTAHIAAMEANGSFKRSTRYSGAAAGELATRVPRCRG